MEASYGKIKIINKTEKRQFCDRKTRDVMKNAGGQVAEANANNSSENTRSEPDRH